jgi:hypothetical protein
MFKLAHTGHGVVVPTSCVAGRHEGHELFSSQAGIGSNGAFGDAWSHGMHMQARLVRSSGMLVPAGCHLMPCPRGSLNDLKLVPLESLLPGHGEVKVQQASLTFAMHDAGNSSR